MVEPRSRYQVIIRIEIIANRRKIARIHPVHPNSREIELWSCHRQHNINQIINEKRSDQHKANLLEPLETLHEVIKYHNEHHRIIKKIAHIKRLAEPDGWTMLAELYRRLAPEQCLLIACKQIIKVREQTIEFKRIGIPISKQTHLHHHTDKCRQPARKRLIQEYQHKCQNHNTQTFQ